MAKARRNDATTDGLRVAAAFYAFLPVGPPARCQSNSFDRFTAPFTVRSTERKPFWRGLLEDGELVAQGQDLDHEFGPRSEVGPNRREEGSHAWTHTESRYQQKLVSSIAATRTGFSLRTAAGHITRSARHRS